MAKLLSLFTAACLAALAFSIEVEPRAAGTPPTTHTFPPSAWLQNGELLWLDVPRYPLPLERVRISAAIEARCTFTWAASGGTATLEYAGAGLRCWTPYEVDQFLRRDGQPITASRLGWGPWLSDEGFQGAPWLVMRGRGWFGWSHGGWNSEGIATPPDLHARWPTTVHEPMPAPWVLHGYVDQKTHAVWATWVLDERHEVERFEGTGTARLLLSPTFSYQIDQEDPPWVPYIPIQFERRLLGLSVIYTPTP